VLERLRFPGITGVEIWDVLVDGAPLHELPADQLPAAIARAVLDLLVGVALRASSSAVVGARVDEVVVAGGGPVDDVVAALVAAAVHARAAPDPLFIAAAAGFRVLRSRGIVNGTVVDLGQTSAKIAIDGGARARLPRPPDGLAFARQAAHERTVLALPCEIDDDGTLGACSYWPAGTRLDIDNGLVCNDAELAAASIAAGGSATLVLTIGYGVGAAVVHRSVSL
jgi:hypothetical protein